MKFLGSVEPLGSSSARKYLSTCVSCFQKFKVSCCISISSACSCPSRPFVSCPVLSSIYPSYRASVLHSFYLHSSSPPPSSLPSSSLPPSFSLPNRLYPSTFSFSFSFPSSPKKEQQKKATHLKLLMTIKQQNIHRLQLIHISMPLKFLSNFGSNFRHGHIERIHGLDFRCLLYPHTHSDDQYSFFPCPYPSPYTPSPFSSSLSFSSYFFLPATCCFKIKKKKSNIPLSTNPDNSTKLSVSHHSMSRLLITKSNSLVSFRFRSRIHHHHHPFTRVW